MRLSSQSNQFILNFPVDFIEPYLYEQFKELMDKNFVPYDTVLDYINSTIKNIVFPGMTFEISQQTIKRGKKIAWKEAGSIYDKFTNELDITFRSVDSHLNYFMLVQILIEFYLNNKKHYVPDFLLTILDHHGDVVYNILIKEILLKNISELRLDYNLQDVSEKTFSVSFRYNFIEPIWQIKSDPKDNEKSVFDIPIQFENGILDQ